MTPVARSSVSGVRQTLLSDSNATWASTTRTCSGWANAPRMSECSVS